MAWVLTLILLLVFAALGLGAYQILRLQTEVERLTQVRTTGQCIILSNIYIYICVSVYINRFYIKTVAQNVFWCIKMNECVCIKCPMIK